MNLTFLIIAAVLLCCFFAAYLWFAVINRRLNDISFGSHFFGNVFFPVWLVAFAGCTALYFLLPERLPPSACCHGMHASPAGIMPCF